MKTRFTRIARMLALTGTILCLAPLTVSATDYAAHRDTPARQLKKNGQIDISSVDEFVRVGSSKEIVVERLGEPTATLSDGSLMYSDFAVNGSGASGILVVRFRQDSVRDIKICTPIVAKSLKTNPALLDLPVVSSE